ncbi:MAG TPA: hypothetical protein VLU24_14105, partial [Mycobacterium sp.]|nr:hypothetical protein [Mycobacterium sp.]
EHVCGRGPDQRTVFGVDDLTFGTQEPATAVHQPGFRDERPAVGLSVIADVDVGCDGELRTQVITADEARGTGSIRQRREHPAVNGAFEKPPHILGERHGQFRQTRLLVDDAELQSVVDRRSPEVLITEHCSGPPAEKVCR